MQGILNPKRPLWTELDQARVKIDGKLFRTSNSSMVTRVDTSNIDTQGLSLIVIDYDALD